MGLGRWQIVTRHALKNALIPVVTVIGFRLACGGGASFYRRKCVSIAGVGTTVGNGRATARPHLCARRHVGRGRLYCLCQYVYRHHLWIPESQSEGKLIWQPQSSRNL